MRNPINRSSARVNGSALLIVLAFLLLLTAVAVAFLARATLERQLSNASFSQGKVDLAGQGAVASIIADLQQEIAAGSNATGGTIPTLTNGFYYPNAPATAVPAIVGFTPATGVENLVKISKSGVAFYSGSNYSASGVARASSVNTYSNPSLNNRLVSLARWNLPLLMQPINVTSDATDFTPPSAFTKNPPDWIYVARDGSNPTTWSTSYEYLPTVSPLTTPSASVAGTNPVTQRYAYTIYNEGGTLDLNVAGSPMINSGSGGPNSFYQPYKSSLAYADLTQLPGISTLNSTQQATVVNAITCWRNYASSNLQNLNIFPNTYTVTASTATTTSNITVPSSLIGSFDAVVLFNRNAFLTIGPNSLYDTPNQKGNLDQTDNAFASRRHLLQFFIQGLGHNSTFTGNISLATLESLLPYLGTFSRGLSQPSYAPQPLVVNATYNSTGSSTGRPAVLPLANGGNAAAPDNNSNAAVDDKINPAFLNITVPTPTTTPANAPTNGSFQRNDGSWAIVGEPLVKKRFALSRLAWLTYQGPSANRTATDADMVALTNAGIPASYLAEGTATNIKIYFGLEWDSTNSRWLYDYHNSGGTPAAGSKGSIMRLVDVASASSPREPDFFELLKAGISVGSLGRSLTVSSSAPLTNNVPGSSGADLTATSKFPPNFNYPFEISTDIQIIQIGANIIDQYQTSGCPVRIAYDDGKLKVGTSSSSLREYVSVENYPYFYGVETGVIPALQPNATTSSVTTDGIGVVTQFPIIWNPHDPNTPVGTNPPTVFRIVADQTDPDSLLQGTAVSNYLMCYATDSTGNRNSNRGSTKVTFDNTTPYKKYNQGTDLLGANSTYQLTSPGNAASGADSSNSAIDLTITSGNVSSLFREPTVIMTAGGITCGSNAYSALLEFVPTDTVIKAVATTTGVTCVVANPTDTPTGETPATREAANQRYLGFYLGAFPLAWTNKGPAAAIFASGAYIATTTGATNGSVENTYITYRMQYEYPANSGNWITYDTKYGAPLAAGSHGLYWVADTTTAMALANTPYMRDDYIAGAVDPRTSRFGLFARYASSAGTPYNYVSGAAAGSAFLAPEIGSTTANETWWLDTTTNTMSTFRMDASSGNWFHGPFLPTGLTYGQVAGWNLPWGSNGYSAMFYPGLLEQNCTQLHLDASRFLGDAQVQGYDTSSGDYGSSTYYADPDGVVRRADAGYIPPGDSSSPTANNGYSGSADTTLGLPMTKMTAVGTGFSEPATVTAGLTSAYALVTPSGSTPTQNISRPYILHRPFLSVAELGYAFRGTPWKSVNFSMPESGDSALLDIFTLTDTNVTSGLEAGRIDLNTRQPYVLAALLANAYLDDPEAQSGSSGATAVLSSSEALTLAQGIVNRTTDTNATDIANGAGPFQNLSDLVGKWNNQTLASCSIIHPTGVLPAAGPISNQGFIDGMLGYKGFSGMPTPSPGTVNSSSYASSSTSPTNLMSLYTTIDTSGNQPFGFFPTGTKHNGLPEAMAYVKRYHEAPIRALVNGTQTRVWNLMIDVIAQTGRFPVTAANASTPMSAFIVEGERRYWVHVAIDRYTGKVIDKLVEEIKE